MVPGAGLEPARPFERGILNPLCLPISPPGQSHVCRKHWQNGAHFKPESGKLSCYFCHLRQKNVSLLLFPAKTANKPTRQS